MRTSPDIVELVHDGVDDAFFVGDDSGFEVAAVFALCAEACSGDIGASCVGESAVDDGTFEMNARAKNSLDASDESWVFVEVLSEGLTRLFSVQKANLDFSGDKIGEHLKEGDHTAVLVHVHVFEVGGGQPEELLGMWDALTYDLLVYFPVCYEIQHWRKCVCAVVSVQQGSTIPKNATISNSGGAVNSLAKGVVRRLL